MNKRLKKPKLKKISFLLASEIKNYIYSKFDTENNEFWEWFFSECSWGKSNSLDLTDDDHIQNKFKDYYKIIKNEFISYADEEDFLEIENDLY